VAHGNRAFTERSNTLPADSSRGYWSDEALPACKYETRESNY
jgi:hypothetical protein